MILLVPAQPLISLSFPAKSVIVLKSFYFTMKQRATRSKSLPLGRKVKPIGFRSESRQNFAEYPVYFNPKPIGRMQKNWIPKSVLFKSRPRRVKFARVEGRFGVENRSKWPFLIVYCLIAILIESLFLIFIKIHLRLSTSKTIKPFQKRLFSRVKPLKWLKYSTFAFLFILCRILL